MDNFNNENTVMNLDNQSPVMSIVDKTDLESLQPVVDQLNSPVVVAASLINTNADLAASFTTNHVTHTEEVVEDNAVVEAKKDEEPTVSEASVVAPVTNEVAGMDVAIPQDAVAAEKVAIIVDGLDITDLPVEQLTEAIADKMTEEQADMYTRGFTPEQMAIFRDVYGFIVNSPQMSEEELEERSRQRAALSSSIGYVTTGNNENRGQAVSAAPVVTKTEQTGNVIFGVRG